MKGRGERCVNREQNKWNREETDDKGFRGVEAMRTVLGVFTLGRIFFLNSVSKNVKVLSHK